VSRKVEEGTRQAWELKNYVWRGEGEKSALTGKQVRPIVAQDTAGQYHAGLRNWSYNAKDKATGALYHHSGCSSRAEAISRSQGMCKEWASAHRELASDMKKSAAQKYGSVSRQAVVADRHLQR
jgi:hypothetical protein